MTNKRRRRVSRFFKSESVRCPAGKVVWAGEKIQASEARHDDMKSG